MLAGMLSRPQVAEHKRYIMQLYQKGMLQREIAVKIGARQQYVSYWLREWGVSGPNRNFLQCLTVEQKSILLGTLLGDGSLMYSRGGKNPLLRWSHGPTQEKFLIWKAQQFGPLFRMKKPTWYQAKDGNWSVRMSSRCHPLLHEYHKLFYCRPKDQITPHIHEKMLTQAQLNQVDNLALAVWWMDDGSLNRNARNWETRNRRDALVFMLGALTNDEYELFQSWMEAQGYRLTRKNQQSGNSVMFSMGVDDSEHLAARIYPHIPPCMQSKLGSVRLPKAA